ncbi:hypothetical protein HK12_08760 [Acetobacter orientalis]|uniref:Uncharacterized protein n=1 Tax=Acetobacter orientalis TaxID=146474 RepID=A0A252A078_9PROT|nr:hypothetical protein HK12_08760 [Acetobacter orientalis]
MLAAGTLTHPASNLPHQPLHPVEILFQNSLWGLKGILSLQTPPLCQTKRCYGFKAEYLLAAKKHTASA